MNPIIRAYDASLDVSPGERTIVATINTDGVDRLKTVILPEGGDFTRYRKNPVVLFNHQGSGCATPIGKNLWIKAKKDRLIAKTQFLPEGTDEFADKVFKLYQLGYLSGWSIMGLQIDWGRPTAQELRKRPDWANAEIIIRKWELLEYSAVTIPGNQDALTEAVSRGLSLPGWPTITLPAPQPARPSLPPLIGRSFDQVLQATIREVTREVKPAAELALRDARELARGMV